MEVVEEEALAVEVTMTAGKTNNVNISDDIQSVSILGNNRRDLIQEDDDDVITFENHYEYETAQARRMPYSDFGDSAVLSPYSAYSPSAVVEAERVVYVNYATEEDFQTLRQEHD